MTNFEDFPFFTWNTFYTCIGEMLESEYYGLKYPKFHDFLQNGTMIDIFESLVASQNSPQDGLNGFIDCVLQNPRYAIDYMADGNDFISPTIRFFYSQGASYTNITKLLDLPAESAIDDGCNFEERVMNYNVRGAIIDILANCGMDVSGGHNWRQIDEDDWENLLNHPNYH